MSWNPALDPTVPVGDAVDAIETVIVPRARDLGGFEVRRALPAARRQMVGPFIFFDQMGPAEFLTGQGIDVRPASPHRPRDGHLPVAGPAASPRFARHRPVDRARARSTGWSPATASPIPSAPTGPSAPGLGPCSGSRPGSRCPEAQEDAPPAFEHAARDALPLLEGEGKRLRLILGTGWGERAPVTVPSETFYADAELAPGAALPLPDDHEDRGVYILQGGVSVGGESYEAGRMLVFRPGDRIAVKAGEAGARLLAPRGCDDERSPLHLVELRRLIEGPHRRRQRGLAGRRLGPRPFPPAACRRWRLHPGAGALSLPGRGPSA